MTRSEHVRWCKQRALEYVAAGNLVQAITSMISDLGMHEETAGLANIMAPFFIYELQNGTAETIRHFIQGFTE